MNKQILSELIVIDKGKKLSKEEKEEEINKRAQEIIKKLQEEDIRKYGEIAGKYEVESLVFRSYDGKYKYEYSIHISYTQHLYNSERKANIIMPNNNNGGER